MADRTETPAEGEEKKPKKGVNKSLVLMLCAGAVVLLAATAGSVILLTKEKSEDPGNPKAVAELKGEKKAEKSGHGGKESSAEADSSIYKFEMPFFVTLADTKFHKVLQFYLSVEFNDPAFVEVVKQSTDKFRDAVYTEVSTRTRADVTSLEGKERLRRDLISTFDNLLEKPGAVRGIYFPDYVLPL